MNYEKLFEEIYFEYRLKPLFEQVLRELAEATSEQTGKVFARLSNEKLTQKIDPVTDEAVQDTTNKTLSRYGGGMNRNFTLRFTQQEEEAENRIDAWLNNYLKSIRKELNRLITATDKIGTKIKDSFRSKIIRQ